VAERAIPVSHPGGGGVIGSFSLEVPEVDDRAHYAVAAEIERPAASGIPLIATTRRHPVLTHGAGTDVALQLRRLT